VGGIDYGRVRMQPIADASGDKLIQFICNSVFPGSVVRTDSLGGYNNIQKAGYIHPKINIASTESPLI